MKIIIGIIIILSIFAIFFEIYTDRKECIKGHQETYYDTSGTAMWLATKNVAFIANNGYKNRFVCDEYKNN